MNKLLLFFMWRSLSDFNNLRCFEILIKINVKRTKVSNRIALADSSSWLFTKHFEFLFAEEKSFNVKRMTLMKWLCIENQVSGIGFVHGVCMNIIYEVC